VSWEVFLDAHPDAAAAFGLAGVRWASQLFYTKDALEDWLRAKSRSYARWASSHVPAASSLD
jgi:hypothetical protein